MKHFYSLDIDIAISIVYLYQRIVLTKKKDLDEQYKRQAGRKR